MKRLGQWAAAFSIAACVALTSRGAQAIPTAHILRIDPRAGVAGGQPILTTVIELVQFNSPSQALGQCVNLSPNDSLDCGSDQMEKDGVLWSPLGKVDPKDPNHGFPLANALFSVKVNGSDAPATPEGNALRWGESDKEPNVGTAWVVALDASNGMGARFADAREVAYEFIKALKPNDMMELMVFDTNERQYVLDSHWIPGTKKNDLVNQLSTVTQVQPSRGRDRALFSIIKGVVSDGFGSLGNTGGPSAASIPLHQAMVVLSNGAGRGDPASASPSAEVFSQYMDKGRFPDDNSSAPKTPLPVISVWFPNPSGLTNDVYHTNDAQFMQALANTEIGGFYDMVRQGQGEARGPKIVHAVRKRFDSMYIVKWRLSCLNLSPEQSFSLNFQKVTPTIVGDSSFKDVPIGVDPSQWPLDVDVAKTKAEADANPLHPGGQFKVYGNFCWAGDKNRAEAYFIPAGTQPDPKMSDPDPLSVKNAMQSLISQNMRGGAIDASDTFVTLQVPDEDKVLEGTGDAMVSHVIIYDNGAKRASSHDPKSILTLKAEKKPMAWLLIAGIGGGVVVVGLLVVVLLRGGGGGGGGGKRKQGQPPPQPVVAGGPPPYGGGGYTPPPGGGYGGAPPPYGGGPPPYGGSPGGGGFSANPPLAPHPAEPAGIGGAASSSPVQVRCPACGSLTMATPGAAGVCFSCGQPLPSDVALRSPSKPPPAYPLTGLVPEAPVAPPNPYARTVSSAVLSGGGGQFPVRAGLEVKLGRDPAQCAIALSEPRISGVHATIKFDGEKLWVRDEASNNGVYVAGARVPAMTWTPVPAGTPLRFGPIEFTVRLEG